MARKVAALTLPKQTIWVPVESFAPEPYEVLRRFTAVVTPLEEGFEAGFYDANIHASGDTEQEAVENLKSLLLDYFDRLNDLDDSELGPEPKRQKRILNVHIVKSPGKNRTTTSPSSSTSLSSSADNYTTARSAART